MCHYMELFNSVEDDGTYGDNGQSEFCGFVNGDDLEDVYGGVWGSSAAVCITEYNSGKIVEADILLNPSTY